MSHQTPFLPTASDRTGFLSLAAPLKLSTPKEKSAGSFLVFIVLIVLVLLIAGQGIMLWTKGNRAQVGQSRFRVRTQQSLSGALEEGRERIRTLGILWTPGASSAYTLEVDEKTKVTVSVDHLGFP